MLLLTLCKIHNSIVSISVINNFESDYCGFVNFKDNAKLIHFQTDIVFHAVDSPSLLKRTDIKFILTRPLFMTLELSSNTDITINLKNNIWLGCLYILFSTL